MGIAKALGTGIAFWALAGCAAKRDWAPLERAAAADSALTLVWSGKGEAWRAAGAGWERDSAYDYSFTVVQERGKDAWHSIKTLQRAHPRYDGLAGPRAQTYSFAIGFRPAPDGLASKVASTLGDGEGISDREFRRQRLDLALPDPSRYAPYTHIRISQLYRYEDGRLEETVELVQRRGGGEKAFMKVEERAEIFVKGRLDGPPSRL